VTDVGIPIEYHCLQTKENIRLSFYGGLNAEGDTGTSIRRDFALLGS